MPFTASENLTHLPRMFSRFLGGNVTHWREKDALMGACIPAYLNRILSLLAQMRPLQPPAQQTFAQITEYTRQWEETANTSFEAHRDELHRIALELGNLHIPTPDIDALTPANKGIQFELRAWFRGENVFAVLEEVGYRDNTVAFIPAVMPSQGPKLALDAFRNHPHSPLEEVRSYPHTLYFTQDCGLAGQFVARWLQVTTDGHELPAVPLLAADIERRFRQFQLLETAS